MSEAIGQKTETPVQFTPDWVREQLALAEQVVYLSWTIKPDEDSRSPFFSIFRGAYLVATGFDRPEAQYITGAAIHYPAALREITRLQGELLPESGAQIKRLRQIEALNLEAFAIEEQSCVLIREINSSPYGTKAAADRQVTTLNRRLIAIRRELKRLLGLAQEAE